MSNNSIPHTNVGNKPVYNAGTPTRRAVHSLAWHAGQLADQAAASEDQHAAAAEAAEALMRHHQRQASAARRIRRSLEALIPGGESGEVAR